MIKYEKVTSTFGLESIQRTDEDGKIWSIPMDENNSDYQRYLADPTGTASSQTIVPPTA